MTAVRAKMSSAEARRQAKYHAGLILESALGEGWGAHEDQVQKFGPEGAEKVTDALTDLAVKLVEGGRI